MSDVDIERLRAVLIRHEGNRYKPYRDSVGNLTIGVGRNLDDVGITADESGYMLDNDLGRCEMDLRRCFDWFPELDVPRQEVLMNMVFNLGIVRLRGFRKMLQAIQQRDFYMAADEMLASKWANQVGDRAKELARAMRTGRAIT